MNRKYTVSFDFDGVLNNLPEAWVNALYKRYQVSPCYGELKYYNMSQNYPTLSDSEILDILQEGEFWKTVEINQKGLDVIESLKQFNVESLIVTATDPAIWEPKWVNCLSKVIPTISPMNIIQCSRKELIQSDIHVDDCPDHLMNNNAYTILFSASYNQDTDTIYIDQVAHDWDDVYNKIINAVMKGELK